MSVPDYQSLMRPLLKRLADGQVHPLKDITRQLADEFGLSEEERRKLQPSGKHRMFDNRVQWAKLFLKRAGLVDDPARAKVQITDAGKKVIAQNPKSIDNEFLQQFPSFQQFTTKKAGPQGQKTATVSAEQKETPEELLESSYYQLREALAEELLEKVRDCSPQFFERLVVELLVSMGYGGSLEDAGQAVGGTGDGGIDGTIKEDRLGLDVVCIQAKRWKGTVGRPEVQAFAGSMEGHRARKGVLITTSTPARPLAAHLHRPAVQRDQVPH